MSTTYEAVHAWLAHGSRPAGLICLNDRIAMGAYQALAAHGLQVPRDVSVVSFDGSELAGWLRPELTSVVLPFAACRGCRTNRHGTVMRTTTFHHGSSGTYLPVKGLSDAWPQ